MTLNAFHAETDTSTLPLYYATEQQVTDARTYIAGHATSAADEMLLLASLGISPDE